MRVDLFDFELPEERIALRPVEPRDAARLLVVKPGETSAAPHIEDRQVADLPQFLRSGDVLVLNDTRVIPSRLHGVRHRNGAEARIELMLHKREGLDYWRAFARPAKRLKIGDKIRFGHQAEGMVCELARLDAVVEDKGDDGEVLVRFSFAGAFLDEALVRFGELPLPPYIAGKRQTDLRDNTDYQTIYAREEGAVAAPTAGLHFTENLFKRLDERDIRRVTVTLHVGAGTFLPVKADDTAEHRMHAEWGQVSEETANVLNEARRSGGRIVAIGTTSLRLLESAADEAGVIHPFRGDTAIFITPGYRFRAVDILMSNFHLPRSTLFMLTSAFCGLGAMQVAYAHAIAEKYRFYSYGDATLLFPEGL